MNLSFEGDMARETTLTEWPLKKRRYLLSVMETYRI